MKQPVSEGETVQLNHTPSGIRPLSSVVERRVHIADVVGSTPTVATTPSGGVDLIARMLADDAWRMSVEERFWPKVMKPLAWDACWPWTGAKRGSGRQNYGNFKLRSHQTERAHRVSFALYNGRSPGSLLVCHRCDNPVCVNPSHLFLGTVQDNSDDMVAKGRAAKRDQSGERNGAAKLSAEQVEAIRERIRMGKTNVAIAAQFGVTHQLISRIRRGRAWGSAPMQKPYASLRAG